MSIAEYEKNKFEIQMDQLADEEASKARFRNLDAIIDSNTMG